MPDFAFRSSADERRKKVGDYSTPRNNKEGKPMTSRNIESRVMEEQHENIRKRFGPKIADEANYGWGVGEGENGGVSIATKVYHPKGAKVLTSEADKGDTMAMHRWGKY